MIGKLIWNKARLIDAQYSAPPYHGKVQVEIPIVVADARFNLQPVHTDLNERILAAIYDGKGTLCMNNGILYWGKKKITVEVESTVTKI